MKAIVFNDTSSDDHHGCQLVMKQIDFYAEMAGIDIVFKVPMGYDWRNVAWIRSKFEDVDLCIINGEGTMHNDASSALELGALAEYCFGRKIPCFLINTVWQNNKLLNKYARFFDAVYVRDSLSCNELKEVGVKATIVPDLTLTINSPLGISKKRHGVIVNGSVMPSVLAAAWKVKKEAVFEDVDYLSIRTIPPMLLSVKWPRRNIKSIKKRIKQYRHIAKSYLVRFPAELSKRGYSLLRWRHSIFSTSRFVKRVAQSEGVVTGRFHLVTLCLVTQTPFYAISSNTFKIEGMLKDAGLHGRVFDSYSIALEERASLAFSDAERDSIESYIAGARVKALDMFTEIKRLSA